MSLDAYPGDAEMLRRLEERKKKGAPIDCGPGEVKPRRERRKRTFVVSVDFTAHRHPDGHFVKLKGVIYGAPRTKKNSNTFHGIASKAYRTYRSQILADLAARAEFIPCMPSVPLNLEAQFYVDSAGMPSDLSGLLQALSDILQDAGFITNDKWLRGFDRSRKHEFDTLNPRTEFTLEALPIL